MGVGAAAHGVLGLIGADAVRTCNIHAKLDLPDDLATKFELRAEGPVVLNETAIGSVLGPEAGANLGTRIDDVDKERAVLDNPVLDVLGNGVRRVVGFDLCAVARGSITSVGNAGGDVAEEGEGSSA